MIGDSEADEKLAKIWILTLRWLKMVYKKKITKFNKKYVFNNFYNLSRIINNRT